MIHSMTGFGEAQREFNGRILHLDVRSVNNRYFKASVRVPEDYLFLEPLLEQRARHKLQRGSASIRVHVRDVSVAAAVDLNVAALRHYLTEFQKLLTDFPQMTLDLATLAQLPGVCQPHELTLEERERAGELILSLADEALARLTEMRATEGAALAEDLRKHCAIIQTQVGKIEAHAPDLVAAYRDRLLQRVELLVAGSGVELGQEDLLKEVSIFAERSDVSEELSRLASHLQQFYAALDSAEPAGRKLEFIAQEMLREANTIGSKAGDADTAERVIEIKGALDRIKEQVQNVA